MAHVVKSFFGKPRCSEHGCVVEETGYSFPFAAYRCPLCRKDYKMKKEIADLKKDVSKLLARQSPNKLKDNG